ncbi:MAG: hypothetical protein PHG14_00630 [Desulfobacter postgatei]|uniref:Uncharacterized protein n=1 Tax=Desulfobacter postgatei 2ac9 TaxID=879212 RepID=I5B2K9_9BACT|nr:hypothetical protein [Desulfobacter postgatei]EIM63722.1 hypothetical protein DespoDRAFT_01807 [Desulfobacter postgatei 2ac9]MDD4272214.1 hypothetical protein [Desulfobacter postgatei]
MTRNFASLALARLYEKQGYIDDALEIYRAIDTSRNPDAQNILDTISRLDAQKKTASSAENLKAPNHDVLKPDQLQAGTKEAGMARMLEVWLKLIVMQKRVDTFKAIKARL